MATVGCNDRKIMGGRPKHPYYVLPLLQIMSAGLNRFIASGQRSLIACLRPRMMVEWGVIKILQNQREEMEL